MSQIPFHKQCKPYIEKLVKSLDVTSAWVCKINFDEESYQVIAFAVAESANPMEKVSDLFEIYNLNKTPKLKNWSFSQPNTPLLFQIKMMPPNDPDRREYVINKVNTAYFVPLHDSEGMWGWLEIWETRRQREFSDVDLEPIEKAVGKLTGLLKDKA